jgi:hypothetical protein
LFFYKVSLLLVTHGVRHRLRQRLPHAGLRFLGAVATIVFGLIAVGLLLAKVGVQRHLTERSRLRFAARKSSVFFLQPFVLLVDFKCK